MMTKILRLASVVLGIILLIISIVWSRDGFQFDFGENMENQWAVFVGYSLALAATCLQFVFSTDFKKLNLTMFVLGLVAYVYSILTNVSGIALMQSNETPNIMVWVLAIMMDVAPEPMIAWGLGEAMTGDLIGNIGKILSDDTSRNQSRGSRNPSSRNQKRKNRSRNRGRNRTYGSDLPSWARDIPLAEDE